VIKEAADRVLSGGVIDDIIEDLAGVLSGRKLSGEWTHSGDTAAAPLSWAMSIYKFSVAGLPYRLSFIRNEDTEGRIGWSVTFCILTDHGCKFKRLEAGVGTAVFNEVVAAVMKFVKDKMVESPSEDFLLRFAGADPGLEDFYDRFVPFLIKRIGQGAKLERRGILFTVVVPGRPEEQK
jgi:hypothetical protein